MAIFEFNKKKLRLPAYRLARLSLAEIVVWGFVSKAEHEMCCRVSSKAWFERSWIMATILLIITVKLQFSLVKSMSAKKLNCRLGENSDENGWLWTRDLSVVSQVATMQAPTLQSASFWMGPFECLLSTANLRIGINQFNLVRKKQHW